MDPKRCSGAKFDVRINVQNLNNEARNLISRFNYL
ncbi:MAG: hypothetical protein H6Q63_1196 [Firmicutes bacterium]|nr:hypothetical protein [Bacillota bacterium]